MPETKNLTYLEQYKLCGSRDPEIYKIAKLCDRLNLSPEQLIEKRISPINKRISEHKGELITAITREYEGSLLCSGIPTTLSVQAKLNFGIVTEDTKLVQDFNKFLTGIGNAYSIKLPTTQENFFDEKDDFRANDSYTHTLLFFMKKPAVYSPSFNFYNAEVWEDFEKKSRLELLIGNNEATPVLQKMLTGWQYDLASGLLGIELPKNELVENKIKEEQLGLYKDIILAEKQVQKLTASRDEKLKFAKETDGDGVIAHSGYLELVGDEVAVRLHHNPGIMESRNELGCLVATAKTRKYDERGIKLEMKIDAGVIHNLDLKEFFSDRIKKYS